jgi:hypothetical protein
MYTIRCTGHLIKRLPFEITGEVNVPAPTTRLGDWYANRLNIGHRRLILCTNERSLLSVVLPARDPKGLPPRLAGGLKDLLGRLGIPQDQIAAEVSEMSEIVFARTASRRVLGSMNDLALGAEYFFKRGERSDNLTELGEWLAETPCSPIGYRSPMDVAREVLAAG